MVVDLYGQMRESNFEVEIARRTCKSKLEQNFNQMLGIFCLFVVFFLSGAMIHVCSIGKLVKCTFNVALKSEFKPPSAKL